jgi:cobalt-zinc-cadmium efflux system protein
MGHSHGSNANITGRRLSFSIAITLLFVFAEAVTGYFSRSLALLSDAGHNFADALALVLSWYGLWIAQKPSTAKRTFGYHRVGILAALINAVSLVVIALLIFWEAAIRLRHPQPVQSTPMIVVALIAILMNAGISWWLKSAAKTDLNLRSAYLHMVGDAVSAAGVVGAGVIVAFTGASIADPLVSVLIGVLILWSSWGILKESVNVLLEGIPKGMNMAQVEETIAGVHGVLAVHDLHVWTVGSGMVCCSCHVMVNEQSVRSGENVLRAVTEELEHHFGIAHTTIQVEVEGCEPNDMYCVTRAAR